MQGRQQHSFWVHGATGYAAWFGNLSNALGPDYPLYAFQARGTDGISMPHTFDEMVDHYLHCIRLVQGSGPYVLGGYSFGGLIALEMAHKLQQAGEEVRHLVMFDTYPPTQEVLDRHFGHYDDDFLEFYLINYFLKIHEHPERTIRREDIEHLPKRLRLLEMARLAKQRGGSPISVEDIYRYLKGGLLCSEQAEGMYQIYEARPISDTDLLFFKATDGFTGKASAQYWRANNILEGYDYATPWREIIRGPVDIQYLETDHLNMLEEPTLSIAANAIRPLLASTTRVRDTSREAALSPRRDGLNRVAANGVNGKPHGIPPALDTEDGN
jgi:thioesterase domain-containing protein